MFWHPETIKANLFHMLGSLNNVRWTCVFVKRHLASDFHAHSFLLLGKLFTGATCHAYIATPDFESTRHYTAVTRWL